MENNQMLQTEIAGTHLKPMKSTFHTSVVFNFGYLHAINSKRKILYSWKMTKSCIC